MPELTKAELEALATAVRLARLLMLTDDERARCLQALAKLGVELSPD